MAKFTKGDKVTCIDASDYSALTKGKTYEVREIDGEYVRVMDDGGRIVGMYAKRFAAVSRFRAGQEVICIDAELTPYLTKGKRYVVQSVSALSGRVAVYSDKGGRRLFEPERFMDADAHAFKEAQNALQRFEPGEIVPVLHGAITRRVSFPMFPQQLPKKPKTPRTVKIDPVDAKAALTKMLKDVYGIDATVEQVIGSMDKSLELVLGA